MNKVFYFAENNFFKKNFIFFRASNKKDYLNLSTNGNLNNSNLDTPIKNGKGN
jgi:hypothetical protein